MYHLLSEAVTAGKRLKHRCILAGDYNAEVGAASECDDPHQARRLPTKQGRVVERDLKPIPPPPSRENFHLWEHELVMNLIVASGRRDEYNVIRWFTF